MNLLKFFNLCISRFSIIIINFGVLLIPLACAKKNNTTISHSAEKRVYWGTINKQNVVNNKNIIRAKKTDSTSKQVSKKYPPKHFRYYEIDLNQDGVFDYIVESKSQWSTCFVSSDLSKNFCFKLNNSLHDGFSYNFFLQQGKGKMLVLFEFSGFEDSDDYRLRSISENTWQLNKGIEIAPIIVSNNSKRNGLYHGYPWDIKSVVTRKNKETVELKVIDSKPIKILFEGAATQGGSTGSYDYLKNKFQFKSLDVILKKKK